MSDDASMPEEELASFPVWRRAAKAMWVSEILRADGRTFRTRFDRDLQRRAKKKNDDWGFCVGPILLLLNKCHYRGGLEENPKRTMAKLRADIPLAPCQFRPAKLLQRRKPGLPSIGMPRPRASTKTY